MLKQNGIPTDPIVDALVPIVAKQVQQATGMTLEACTGRAMDTIRYYGRGEPFCCKLGDEKLKVIITKVATEYEIKKATQGVMK